MRLLNLKELESLRHLFIPFSPRASLSSSICADERESERVREQEGTEKERIE
jgi:hypothetical protein